ncbi:MAG: hypothetical protein ACOCVM_03935, partial [Desulfovibrionaceae bacterium]
AGLCQEDGIHILSARYGNYALEKAGAELDASMEINKKETFCNAKKALKKLCNGKKTCSFEVSNELCGDPYTGRGKYMLVQYTCGDIRYTVKFDEGKTGSLNCPQ